MNGKLIIYLKGTSSNEYSTGRIKTGYGIHCYIGKHDGKPVAIKGKYKLTTHGYIPKTEIATPIHIKNRLKKSLAFPSDTNTNISDMILESVTEIYGYNKDSINTKDAYLYGMDKALELIPVIVSNTEVIIDDVIFILDNVVLLGVMKKSLLDLLDIEKLNENKKIISKIHDKTKIISKHYNINLAKILPDSDDLGLKTATMLSNMGVKQHSLSDKDDGLELLKFDNSYWKDIKMNLDLFYFKELFNFYPDDTLKNHLYYGINYKDLEDFGKKVSNITYTVLKIPDTMLEDDGVKYVNGMLERIRTMLGGLYVPYVILLDILTNKNVIRNYTHYGDDYIITKMKRQLTIRTMDDLTIAESLYPTGLANIVVSNFVELIRKYNDFKKNEFMDIMDITDKIYDIDKKYSIKKDFINDKYIIKVPYKVSDEYRAFTIRVKPKLDTPSRNILKRFEKQNPIVKIGIVNYQEVIEYRTLVELDNGVDILSDNFYANKVFLKRK